MAKTRNGSSSRFSLTTDANMDVLEILQDIEPIEVQATIYSALKAGVALTFSATRDMSSVCITVLDDGQRHKAYCGTTDELARILGIIREQAEAVE